MGVRIGHRGDRWIELGAWHAVDGEALRFSDEAGALRFLREQLQTCDLRTLRDLLTRDHALLRGHDDAVVLRLVSQRLHTRTLKAVAWHAPHASVDRIAAVWQPARVELPAAQPRESAPVEAPRAAPAAASLMPADWDAEAQALTLRAAAEHGTPFCEICQRAGAGASASSP